MRTYKCKHCTFEAQGNSPHVLIRHAKETHPRARKKRKKAEAPVELTLIQQVGGLDPADDAETALLVAAIALFKSSTDTDSDADGRVLAALNARFATPTYAPTEE